MEKRAKTKMIILVGIMGAISFILQLMELPMFGFLSIEFSDVPPVIMATTVGAIPAVLTELVKNLLKALTTKTSFVGEFANFIIGSAFVIPIGIYFSKLNKKLTTFTIIKVFSISTFTMTLIGGLANYFVLVPFYGNFVGGVDNVVKMVTPFISIIKDKLDLILFYITPFNILKGIFLSIVAFILIRIKIKR